MRTQRRIQRVMGGSMQRGFSGFFATLRMTRRWSGNSHTTHTVSFWAKTPHHIYLSFRAKTKHNIYLVIPSERSESRNLRLVGLPILLRFCEARDANRRSLHCVRLRRTSVGMTIPQRHSVILNGVRVCGCSEESIGSLLNPCRWHSLDSSLRSEWPFLIMQIASLAPWRNCLGSGGNFLQIAGNPMLG